jgi:brefeldin A-inhibited guanine nucleotide-exchange protein
MNGAPLHTRHTDSHQLIIIHYSLMAIFSKISSAHQAIPKNNAAAEQSQTPIALAPPTPGRPSLPPSLTTSALADTPAADAHLSEARLRRLALESLVDVLRSLVAWGIVARQNQQNADLDATSSNSQMQSRASISEDQRLDASESVLDRLSPVPSGSIDLRHNTSDLAIAVDDPSRFESAKQRKTILLEGIRKFNFKPKRVSNIVSGLKLWADIWFKGIQFLVGAGFIASSQPADIAAFVLHTEGLNKTAIGEYLGEG